MLWDRGEVEAEIREHEVYLEKGDDEVWVVRGPLNPVGGGRFGSWELH